MTSRPAAAMRLRSLAAYLVPAIVVGALLAASGGANVGRATIGLRVEPVVVHDFDVADDLSVAWVDLELGPGVSTNAGALDDNRLTLPLRIGSGADMQATTAILRRGGRLLGHVTVEYYPRALYERLGTEDPGYVLLVTDLPRQAVVPGPVTASGPIDPVVVSLVSDQVNWIQATNRTESGRVCPDTSGAELATQVATGGCYVWCTGMAIIVRDALRAAGYEARIDYLEPRMRTLPSGVVRESSEAHASIEYRDAAGWRWIDPTYGVHAAGLSLAEYLLVREPGALVPFAQAGDVSLALERYLTADKIVVPENE